MSLGALFGKNLRCSRMSWPYRFLGIAMGLISKGWSVDGIQHAPGLSPSSPHQPYVCVILGLDL